MDSGRKKNLYRAFAEVATDAYYTTQKKNIFITMGPWSTSFLMLPESADTLFLSSAYSRVV